MEPVHGAVDAPENGGDFDIFVKKVAKLRSCLGSKRAELVDLGEIIFSHILPAVGYLRASWAKPVAIEAVL